MAWVLVTLAGAFSGEEANAAGQPLDLPWDGCELHRMAGLTSLYAAVATAEARDWLVGARLPLLEGERMPDLGALAGPDPAARQAVLAELETALHRVRSIGGRYLVLPGPPLVAAPRAGREGAAGRAGAAEGPAPGEEGPWAAGLAALSELQEAVGVQVVLEMAGPPAGEAWPEGEGTTGGRVPGGLLLGWRWPESGAEAAPGPGAEGAAPPVSEGEGTPAPVWADHLWIPADLLAGDPPVGASGAAAGGDPVAGGAASAGVAAGDDGAAAGDDGSAGTAAGREPLLWLSEWARVRPRGRIVLAPPAAGPAAEVTRAALARARRLLGREG
ncbi:MAG: hypothetical protein L6E13_00750 [Firmicutes bacterium]|nr:hypothetical protein [Bacillota bacterium]